MGNHADNFISNLNYISGLLDSDGSVYIVERTVRGNKLRLSPKITFTNTNFDLVEVFSTFLHDNNVNHHVSTRDRKTIYKVEKTITVSRLSKCMKLAQLLIPTCICRRSQLELLEEFCMDRRVCVANKGWKFANTPYTNRQKHLAKELNKLNCNYNYDTLNRNYTYSWLGGFLDGDGSIFISRHKQGGTRTDIRMEPTISFSGESDTVFNNIKEMFDNIGVKYTISRIKCKAKRIDNNKYKYYYNLAVKNQVSLRILVEKLDGKLLAKSKHLTILDSYLKERLVGGPYTERCFMLCDEITRLNK